MSANQESWVKTLEDFGVAFIGYGPDGHRCHVSTAAANLLSAPELGAALGEQADRLARAELELPMRHPRTSGFARQRELLGVGGTTLAVFAALAGAHHSLVIVFSPSAGALDKQHLPGLTNRESEVARLVASGLATKEIAGRLGISSHTARHHTERIYDKLGVRCRAGLAGLLTIRVVPAVAAG